jgi:flagellar secretion chaperone FliS
MMNHSEIASRYREISARGSHPVGLVVKLYDAILEDFRRAMKAVAEGDIETRTSCLNHALKIIAELQSVLDHERGKEVARRLNGFYDVTRMLIVEANFHAELSHIQRLVELYLPLYHAWRQVEQDAYAGKLQFGENSGNDSSGPEQPATSQIIPADEPSGAADLDTPRVQWNA